MRDEYSNFETKKLKDRRIISLLMNLNTKNWLIVNIVSGWYKSV